MAPLHQLTAKTTKKKCPYHYLMLITFLKEVKKVTSGFKTKNILKVIPLKLFYYQTFFETWRNEHS